MDFIRFVTRQGSARLQSLALAIIALRHAVNV